MDKKEQWANEVLQSLDNIERAEPSADLFAKISAQLPAKEKTAKVIPLRNLRWVAAAACFIISANIYVFGSGLNSAKQKAETASTQEYGLISDYSLYD